MRLVKFSMRTECRHQKAIRWGFAVLLTNKKGGPAGWVTAHNGPRNKKGKSFYSGANPSAVGSLGKQFSSVRGCDVCCLVFPYWFPPLLAAIGLSINFECDAQDDAEEMFQRVQLFQQTLGGPLQWKYESCRSEKNQHIWKSNEMLHRRGWLKGRKSSQSADSMWHFCFGNSFLLLTHMAPNFLWREIQEN